jgi:hypothetical protein
MAKIGGKGSGGNYPKPDAGKYVAVCAAVYDVGVQERTYQGNVSKSQRLAIVWELDAQDPEGNPFTLVDNVPVSLWRNSAMREAASALLDRAVGEDEELDSDELVGKCAMLTVGMSDKGNPYIDRRDGLQDASKAFGITGKYGPQDTLHGLVQWLMNQADEGTVPAGQGIARTREEREDDRKGQGRLPEREPAPTPDDGGPVGQPEDGADDIPF